MAESMKADGVDPDLVEAAKSLASREVYETAARTARVFSR